MVKRSSSNKSQDGVVAIMVAIMLVMLLGFASFVIDVGYLFRTRGELQNAVDSAALSGAWELNGLEGGMDAACQKARQLAKLHLADNTEVNEPIVILGHWNNSCTATDRSTCFAAEGTCNGDEAPSEADPTNVNAVRVEAQRAESNNKQLRLFFGAFLGSPTANVGARAIAIGGGPGEAECGFPIAVADCAIEHARENPANDYCGWCMHFQPVSSEGVQGNNSAWTAFDEQATWKGLRDLIVADCGSPGAFNIETDEDGRDICAGTCDSTSAGETAKVSEKNLAADGHCLAIQDILLRDAIDPDTGAIDPSKVKGFYVSVPVLGGFQCDVNGLPIDSFAGEQPVTGYATVQIFGAQCGNKKGDILLIDAAVKDAMQTTPGCTPPSGEIIMGRLECDVAVKEVANGNNYGTDAKFVRLVL